MVFLACIGIGGYYGWMLLETSRLENEILVKEAELNDMSVILNQEKDDTAYKKYQSAKQVMQVAWQMDRSQNIQYLIELLDELTALDSTDNSIALTNFQITEEKVSLRWSVSSIKNVYREWWVIDKFESFDFIEKITIPYYRRDGDTDMMSFVLDASIQEYEWYDGPL